MNTESTESTTDETNSESDGRRYRVTVTPIRQVHTADVQASTEAAAAHYGDWIARISYGLQPGQYVVTVEEA